MSFGDELSRELAGVGIRGGLRARILAEIADHIACDPGASLGSAQELARQFADELGTSRARRAAQLAFAALAVAGVIFGIAFLTAPSVGLSWRMWHPRSALLGDGAAVTAAIAAQVAFVAGGLALVRALRRRRELVLPRLEAVVIVRRAAVGLAGGVASMAALATIALDSGRGVSGWWTTFALAGAGVASFGLLLVVPVLGSATRVRPTAAGPAGDVFADLGPLAPRRLRGRPWGLALAVASGVAVAIALAGAVQSDGIDGALRGVADGLACLAGFALLGRYLGLRES